LARGARRYAAKRTKPSVVPARRCRALRGRSVRPGARCAEDRRRATTRLDERTPLSSMAIMRPIDRTHTTTTGSKPNLTKVRRTAGEGADRPKPAAEDAAEPSRRAAANGQRGPWATGARTPQQPAMGHASACAKGVSPPGEPLERTQGHDGTRAPKTATATQAVRPRQRRTSSQALISHETRALELRNHPRAAQPMKRQGSVVTRDVERERRTKPPCDRQTCLIRWRARAAFPPPKRYPVEVRVWNAERLRTRYASRELPREKDTLAETHAGAGGSGQNRRRRRGSPDGRAWAEPNQSAGEERRGDQRSAAQARAEAIRGSSRRVSDSSPRLCQLPGPRASLARGACGRLGGCSWRVRVLARVTQMRRERAFTHWFPPILHPRRTAMPRPSRGGTCAGKMADRGTRATEGERPTVMCGGGGAAGLEGGMMRRGSPVGEATTPEFSRNPTTSFATLVQTARRGRRAYR